MTKRTVTVALMVAMALFFLPNAALATPACDSFGQDWNINLGAFGGTFPGTLIVSGCRDCNASLGCGGSLPLDGAATITQPARGFTYSILFSMTAYKPSGSCVSTHWTGSLNNGQTTVAGNVSNEFGPFGGFTLSLGVACRESGNPALDPTRLSNGRWADVGGDDSGSKMIVQ